MKIEQISPHIWRLRSWVFIPITVWLVEEKQGLVLVDTGMDAMGKDILKHILALKKGPLKRILLTHGHSDHAGGLRRILTDTSVPVYAHKRELRYLEGIQPYPRRSKAQQMIAPGIVQTLPMGGIGEEGSLGSLAMYWTPGHSPGHVVYYHEEDKVLLAGDLFTSRSGKLRRPMPMFTADMEEAIDSSRVVQRLQPDRMEICHGDAVLHPAEQMERYLARYAGAEE
ncbi:MBL fold metallo-hydrolase [Paenibacillus daejeonensis]|uniref:MBL fold metallo-hydrolase n=1 Tax=Paenibacillus daejeonensis TaxID=135193 RepID=UPI000365D127|nr:MBL fold metallo-hydrolase [Paenibacillus daejeonensis]